MLSSPISGTSFSEDLKITLEKKEKKTKLELNSCHAGRAKSPEGKETEIQSEKETKFRRTTSKITEYVDSSHKM